jgi:hypothetical protein
MRDPVSVLGALQIHHDLPRIDVPSLPTRAVLAFPYRLARLESTMHHRILRFLAVCQVATMSYLERPSPHSPTAIAYSVETAPDRIIAATRKCRHFKEQIDHPNSCSHLNPF